VTQGFSNPIAAGSGALTVPSIHSPGYTPGSTGWSINKDGTAEFNGITVRGTVILGNGTTNTIILDNTRSALFVYDNSGKLVESVAANSGTDALGNNYVAGFGTYDGTPGGLYSSLIAGLLAVGTGSAVANTQPFNIFGGTGGGPHNDQPYAVLKSPADSGIPTPITSQLEMFGEDQAQLRSPLIRMRQAGILVDTQVLVQGEVVYSAPGATNWAETWHSMALAANWAVLGAPWAAPSYRKSNGGTVELAGAVQWTDGVTAAPVQITQLPTGYRPPTQKHLFTMTMPGPGATPQLESLEIRTDGTLWLTNYPAGGPNTPITLDGAWFPLGI
jgi:hypothetical protein